MAAIERANNEKSQAHLLWRYRTDFLGWLGRLNRDLGFKGWAWVCAIAWFFGVVWLSSAGYSAQKDSWWDALYKSLQIFGLNYSEPECAATKDCTAIDGRILWARMLAPAVLIAAIIKLLADGVGHWLRRINHTGLRARSRDVVLGYGNVAQEVGERLLRQGRAVTWIAQIKEGDEALQNACRQAERAGGFLLCADPSTDRSFELAHAELAERIFVVLEDDSAGLDAAEALRLWLKREPSFLSRWMLRTAMQINGRFREAMTQANPPPRIRFIAERPELANTLPHAAAHGFVSGRSVMTTSLRADGARRLVLRARWDRLALLLRQERVHLVLVGCGWQGEALLEETLLLSLRAGLKAPLVTVLDAKAETVKDRIKARSPALFDEKLAVEGWQPPRFVTCDLKHVDFSALKLTPNTDVSVPITAWAFCTGDDELNLRAALACQIAMQRHQIDGAPIHARVWNGHELGEDSLTQVNIFGSLKDGLDQTSALDEFPDKIALALHRAYLESATKMPALGQSPAEIDTRQAVADWEKVMVSKQRSNRRAQAHAPMKLADLGFDWHSGEKLRLPKFLPDQTVPMLAAISSLVPPPEALAQNAPAYVESQAQTELAKQFLGAMVNEHNRWTVDRAIDGWSFGPNRDETRLKQENMTNWDSLTNMTRAYDGVLLRALITEKLGAEVVSGFAYRQLSITLSDGQKVRASLPVVQWPSATEIIISLPSGNLARPEKTKLDMESKAIIDLLYDFASAVKSERFCRLILVFLAPQSPPILALANALAEMAWEKGRDVQAVWAWGVDGPRAIKTEVAQIEINQEVLSCPTS
jgi:hypothetical protein